MSCLVFSQEVDTKNLTGYKKSIMALSDGGKLYRSELEIVLCREPMLWTLTTIAVCFLTFMTLSAHPQITPTSSCLTTVTRCMCRAFPLWVLNECALRSTDQLSLMTPVPTRPCRLTQLLRCPSNSTFNKMNKDNKGTSDNYDCNVNRRGMKMNIIRLFILNAWFDFSPLFFLCLIWCFIVKLLSCYI